MASVLEFLKSDTKAGEVYLNKIEKPQYAERFKKSISRSEQVFDKFKSIYILDFVK
jgi:hypothetical protein